MTEFIKIQEPNKEVERNEGAWGNSQSLMKFHLKERQNCNGLTYASWMPNPHINKSMLHALNLRVKKKSP